MHFVQRTFVLQHRLLALTVGGSALVFWRASYDVFNTVKATWIVLSAISLLTVEALRVSRTRRLVLPVTGAMVPVAVFTLALAVAVAVSETPLRSVVGAPGRHTGLATYFACVALLVVVLRLHAGWERPPTRFVGSLLVAAVLVTLLGLLQALGITLFDWQAIEGGPQVFSTFGNANFLAAWLGVVVPIAVATTLTTTWSRSRRSAAAVLAVVAVGVAAASQSLQGVVNAVAGVAVVVAVWAATDPAGRRARMPLVLSGLGLGGLFALVATGLGPGGAVRGMALRSLETRVGKWQTAWWMFSDRPATGVGLDGFGDWFHYYRPTAVAAGSGLRRTVDDPHNVVLAMFASGGLLLGVAYVAFVAVTAWALVRGLRRLEGPSRLLLAGIGGGWVAYQVQAQVSIDVPPLAVLHWVLAGFILAAGSPPRLMEVVLPGAPAARIKGASGKHKRHRRPRAELAPASVGLIAGMLLLTGGATALALLPLAADVVVARAERLAAGGDRTGAEAAYSLAASLAPWEARYPAMHGRYLTGVGRPADARERHLEAARREPRGLSHALNIARRSAQLGDEHAALEWYRRAVELDPRTPEVLAEVGAFEADHGDPEVALEYLRTALDLRADDPIWWVALGRSYAALGQREGARSAYEHALSLDPALTVAHDGLAAMDGS